MIERCIAKGGGERRGNSHNEKGKDNPLTWEDGQRFAIGGSVES